MELSGIVFQEIFGCGGSWCPLSETVVFLVSENKTHPVGPHETKEAAVSIELYMYCPM